MKRPIKAAIGTALALAAAGGVRAQEGTAAESLDGRLRLEYGGNGSSLNTIRTTFGIAPEGTYGDTPISVKGQFLENVRIYDILQQNGNQWDHSVTAGIRLPELKIGNLVNKALIMGNLGSQEGFGIETTHSYDPLKVTLNAEHRTDSKVTRLGGSLDLNLSETLRVGAGYDTIQMPSGSIHQYLVNAVADIAKGDTIGAAFVMRKEFDESTTKSIAGFWNHYVSNKEWGVRALARVDWNDEQRMRSYNGEIVWAENATTNKYGATWWVGRSVGADEGYNTSILLPSIARTEPIRLSDRTSSGIAIAARASLTEIGDSKFGLVGAGVGYTFEDIVLGGKLGISGDINYQFSNFAKDSITFEPGIVYRKDNMELDIGASIPLQSGDPMFRIGIQWRF